MSLLFLLGRPVPLGRLHSLAQLNVDVSSWTVMMSCGTPVGCGMGTMMRAARQLVRLGDCHRALVYFDVADDEQLSRTMDMWNQVNEALPEGEDLPVLRLNGRMDGRRWNK